MNCAIESIETYIPSSTMPWNNKRVNHFLQRVAFGEQPNNFNALLNNPNPTQAIINQLNNAANTQAQTAPFWGYYLLNDFQSIEQMQTLTLQFVADWIEKMKTDGIREKMILFWMNHFVTQFQVYEFGPFLYQYYNILQNNAFGNFKTFVSEIGLSQAMLIFLNGDENTNNNPNENYARELYELFTLGADNNYTQTDIVETAKALTGYEIDNYTFETTFNPFKYDSTNKTIFGQTGNFGYEDVIDILFNNRPQEIATFVCTKLYKHFVSPNIVTEIVDELAQTFLNNNFELLPVYQQLFTSKHFFDEANICTLIKSPTDVLVNFSKIFDFDLSATLPSNTDLDFKTVLVFLLVDQGQALFNPIDVAGWQQNRDWLTSDTITRRWDFQDTFTNYLIINDPDKLVDFAIEVTNNSNNVFEITQLIIDYFIPNGLQTTQAYNEATIVFKWEVPQNYFDDGTWNLSWEEAKYQIAYLLQYIARLPEFQLF